MAKVDLKRDLKHLYSAPRKPVIVDVPSLNFLMVDGRGDPENSAEFQEAMETLYGVSYTMKFGLKKEGWKDDWVVMPPEGLWWSTVSTSSAASAQSSGSGRS